MENSNKKEETNPYLFISNPFFDEEDEAMLEISDEVLNEYQMAVKYDIPLVKTCKDLLRDIYDWEKEPESHTKDDENTWLKWEKYDSQLTVVAKGLSGNYISLDVLMPYEKPKGILISEFSYPAPTSRQLLSNIKSTLLANFRQYSHVLNIDLKNEKIELNINNNFSTSVEIDRGLVADAYANIYIEMSKYLKTPDSVYFEYVIQEIERSIKKLNIPIGGIVFLDSFHMHWLKKMPEFIQQKENLEDYIYQGRFIKAEEN